MEVRASAGVSEQRRSDVQEILCEECGLGSEPEPCELLEAERAQLSEERELSLNVFADS